MIWLLLCAVFFLLQFPTRKSSSVLRCRGLVTALRACSCLLGLAVFQPFVLRWCVRPETTCAAAAEQSFFCPDTYKRACCHVACGTCLPDTALLVCWRRARGSGRRLKLLCCALPGGSKPHMACQPVTKLPGQCIFVCVALWALPSDPCSLAGSTTHPHPSCTRMFKNTCGATTHTHTLCLCMFTGRTCSVALCSILAAGFEVPQPSHNTFPPLRHLRVLAVPASWAVPPLPSPHSQGLSVPVKALSSSVSAAAHLLLVLQRYLPGTDCLQLAGFVMLFSVGHLAGCTEHMCVLIATWRWVSPRGTASCHHLCCLLGHCHWQLHVAGRCASLKFGAACAIGVCARVRAHVADTVPNTAGAHLQVGPLPDIAPDTHVPYRTHTHPCVLLCATQCVSSLIGIVVCSAPVWGSY